MQVSVEVSNKLERRLTITVPADRLNTVYNEKISRLTQTAKINGFRPGKIPLDVIKKHYGKAAHDEALNEVLTQSFYAALDQEKLKPVGTPMIEPKALIVDQPLEFTATFEVLPEIEAVQFNVDTLEKEIASIGEEDIKKVLDYLQEQHTTWREINGAAKINHKVIIDFSGSINSEKFPGGQANNYPIVLGSNVMVPGFETGIEGMQVGEERIITVQFPSDYFAKEVAGKFAEFAIKLNKLFEALPFEFTPEVVKKLGVKSGLLEDLQGEIRKNLEREMERVIQLKLKNKVFDKLLEQNAFEVPNALIKQEAARIHDNVHPHHGHEDHHHSEEEMAEFNKAAKRNVALGLLVSEIVKQSKISLDKEKVKAALARLIGVYEDPEKVAKWYENNQNAYAEIEMQVLEDQVVAELLKKTTLTEKKLSYNELIK